MKFTIMGFSQKAVLDIIESGHKIDVTDLAILRWFVDFCNTDKISKTIEGNKIYYWINYQTLLQDMPILNIKQRMLYTRLQKMVDANILTHHTKKAGGTYSMYGFGENYTKLITKDMPQNQVQNIATPLQNIADPCKTLLNPLQNIAEPSAKYCRPKDTSTKYPSTKDNVDSSDAAEVSSTSPTVIQLCTNKKNEFFDITKQHIDDFKKWYPNVDVMQELNKIQAWLVSNPTKRKTKRGMMSFVNRWLSKEQDKPQRQYTTDSGYQQQPSTNVTGNPFADALLRAEGGE